ncbi:MAG: hypothetical protein ABSB80_05165 [Methanoregula sp.]|jgi:hypothetical protein|uniref:hypothetical protein n=1 Tax=Methanoregula sp. TaxID=2052170 RepID=UPI003D11B38E
MESIEDNKINSERNHEFVLKMTYRFYKNHIKKCESDYNFIGFLLAANGVLVLAYLSLFSVVLPNGIPFSNFPFDKFLLLLCMSFLPISLFISIWTSIGFLVISRPIPFCIEGVPWQRLVVHNYLELQKDALEALENTVIKNVNKYDKSIKWRLTSIIFFGLTIIAFSSLCFDYALVKLL